MRRLRPRGARSEAVRRFESGGEREGPRDEAARGERRDAGGGGRKAVRPASGDRVATAGPGRRAGSRPRTPWHAAQARATIPRTAWKWVERESGSWLVRTWSWSAGSRRLRRRRRRVSGGAARPLPRRTPRGQKPAASRRQEASSRSAARPPEGAAVAGHDEKRRAEGRDDRGPGRQVELEREGDARRRDERAHRPADREARTRAARRRASRSTDGTIRKQKTRSTPAIATERRHDEAERHVEEEVPEPDVPAAPLRLRLVHAR